MRAISKLHGCSMLLYLTRVMMEMIICFVIIPTVRNQVSKYVFYVLLYKLLIPERL